MKRGNLEYSISTLLILRTLIFSLVIFLILIAIEFGGLYLREERRLDETFVSIEAVHLKPISQAVWVSNTEVLKSQVRSLINLPLIVSAEVREGEQVLASSELESPRSPRTVKYPIIYTYKGADQRIGELTVTADTGDIFLKTAQESLWSFLIHLVGVTITGIFLYILFHRSVLVHLKRLQGYLEEFEIEQPREPLSLTKASGKPYRGDELDSIMDTVNLLMDRLRESYRAVASSKERSDLIATEKTAELVEANHFLSEKILALESSQNELVRVKNEAEMSNRAKTQFLANMSHEIRTPISGIMGMARLLEASELSDEQREYLKLILVSGNSLLAIIEDILDLSKIEANKVSLGREEFDLTSIISEIMQLFSFSASESGVELSYAVDTDIPKKLAGDPDRLTQILRNLISNALKFTPEGGVHLSVGVEGRESQRILLRFEIRDTGIGIEKDKLDKLFDSFYQVESDYAKKRQGTGLGLAISKQLVDMMGGTLEVESEPKQGSRFFFTVPFEFVPEVEDQSANVDREELPVASARWKVKVLIAEDNRINQLYISELLRRASYNVCLASNGKEVLARVEDEDIDLILMDIQMPEMDGISATRELRKSYGRDALPIIAVTAYVLDEEITGFINAGMNDFITKPIMERRLLELVQRYAEAAN